MLSRENARSTIAPAEMSRRRATAHRDDDRIADHFSPLRLTPRKSATLHTLARHFSAGAQVDLGAGLGLTIVYFIPRCQVRKCLYRAGPGSRITQASKTKARRADRSRKAIPIFCAGTLSGSRRPAPARPQPSCCRCSNAWPPREKPKRRLRALVIAPPSICGPDREKSVPTTSSAPPLRPIFAASRGPANPACGAASTLWWHASRLSISWSAARRISRLQVLVLDEPIHARHVFCPPPPRRRCDAIVAAELPSRDDVERDRAITQSF